MRIIKLYTIVLSLLPLLSCSQKIQFENYEFMIEQEHNFRSVNFILNNRGEVIRIESEEFLDRVAERTLFQIENCKIVKILEVKETYNEPVSYDNARVISTEKDSLFLKSIVSIKPFIHGEGSLLGNFDSTVSLEMLKDDFSEIIKNQKKEYLELKSKISECKD